MKVGVVYKFKSHNKVNGSLFYCYEYCQFLRNYFDCVMYVVCASPGDVHLTTNLFDAKYKVPTNSIQYLNRITDLHGLNLDKTLVFDIDTFTTVRGLLTNEVLCYSNDTHDMYRYRDNRHVTYFGSYNYQRYDVFSYLKLYFDLFKPCKSDNGVFISGNDGTYLAAHAKEYIAEFAPKPVWIKSKLTGSGDIFDRIDAVHYVHTSQDKNNRIIPESFFHGKAVTISCPMNIPTDSVQLRYADITANGLANYILTEDDLMVQACLR